MGSEMCIRDRPARNPVVPVPAAWVIVALPMLFGLIYTFSNAVQLFAPSS